MLTTCPECGLQVSTLAITCPHCGFPLKQTSTQISAPQPRKRRKHRRLPNGFGQISEIRGRNLRKPFRAMITVGKTLTGRPICKPLKPESYFETYNEAYMALMNYNKNPYDMDDSITVSELYEQWSEEKFKDVGKTYIGMIQSAWKYCSSIHHMRFVDVRVRHIEGCMNSGVREINGSTRTPSPAVKANIKILFNQLFDYAIKHEIVQVNYARNFSMSTSDKRAMQKVASPHKPYTEEEMEKLWASKGTSVYADMILIQCYSGWRPRELCELKIEHIDLNAWTFTGGMKTEAGTNRTVPIHEKIKGLVKLHAENAKAVGSPFLFNRSDGRPVAYDSLYMYQHKLFDTLAIDQTHRPHDGRVHFITAAKRCQVDEYAIKAMVGHAISDITEKIYTKRDPDWLLHEIQKIV